MKFFWHKCRFVVQATFLVALFEGLLFLVDQKFAPVVRIAICWAVFLTTLVLFNFIRTSPRMKCDRFVPLRSVASAISVFLGVGMFHFLKGDDVGAALFIGFPITCFAIAYFIRGTNVETMAEVKEIAKF